MQYSTLLRAGSHAAPAADIFLAAGAGRLVAWRVRLPLILGFVLGGIAISPFTPGPHVSDLHTFEVFAEVGGVLLMFSNVFSTLIAASLISILLNVFIVRGTFAWLNRKFPASAPVRREGAARVGE